MIKPWIVLRDEGVWAPYTDITPITGDQIFYNYWLAWGFAQQLNALNDPAKAGILYQKGSPHATSYRNFK